MCQNKSMKKDTIANRIKELREERNLTQIDLAKELNLDKSTIAKYETGKVEPSLSIVYLLIEYFNVSADYLLGLVD